MRRVVLAAAALALVPLAAVAQERMPAACQMDAEGRVDFKACADAAPKGSPARSLALINLATQAFLKQDYRTAVRLYDEATPRGKKTFSDPSFHAFRGATYERVGRHDEALEDARTALQALTNAPPSEAPAPVNDPEVVLPYVLPILKRANDPSFPAAMAIYRASPAKDWISHANRAGVLMDLGDVAGALEANKLALEEAPDHPAVLNNACYLLARAGRPQEGLPYCERAVAAAPEIAAIHDSLATALAGTGQCARAESELAVARRIDPATVEYKRKLDCRT